MASESTAAELETIAITGHSQGPKSTHVETEHAEFVVGKEASPLEYMFGSLAACINVIGHMVAKDRDVVLRDLDVTVEGDIDARKYKGEATDPRAGFQSIDVHVNVDTDADDATIQQWIEEVTERCPVADNIRYESTLEETVERY